MKKQPIYIWLIAIFTFIIGGELVYSIIQGTQPILNKHSILIFACIFTVVILVAGISLLLGKLWSKYLYLVIAFLEIYSMFLATDHSMTIEKNIHGVGVPTITYHFPPIGNIIWVIASLLVWWHFRKMNNNA